MNRGAEDRASIAAAIEALEEQRGALGDAATDTALTALRARLAAVSTTDGAIRDARREGELKLVTVVFADVAGFTELAADLGAEETRDLLNRCFDCLVPVVQRYEGTVDKFVGDAIVALFGVPVAHEDDARRAIQAAAEMRTELDRFNVANGTDLGLHFGINTGRVVVGSVGAEGRQDASVMGDAVNIAARLEDLSATGEILVGRDTARLAGPRFAFEPLPDLVVRGKAGPIGACRFLGLASEPRSTSRTRLVGRSAELGMLTDAVRSLGRGAGGRIGIVAEAGLGKSRLVAEARQAAGGSVRWAEGRGLASAAEPNRIVQELIRSMLGIAADAPDESVADALGRALREIAPREATRLHLYLAHLMDVSTEGEGSGELRHLSGDVLHGRVAAALRDFLRLCSDRQPLVLVWEDLHWADPSSLDLLDAVMGLPAEAPILVLLVLRSEPSRGHAAHLRFQELYPDEYRLLELAPLGAEEGRALMAGYLQVSELPPELVDKVMERAEGNPFYFEEILRDLVDAGALSPTEPVELLVDLDAVRIPDTVQGVLAARIDRLSALDKRTLQSASVIGRIVPRTVLGPLLEGDGPADLQRTLDELCRRSFLRLLNDSDGGALPERGYIFQHATTQEVAYRSLLRSHRRVLHGKVAATMERLFPARAEELAATIGGHYQKAGDHERALDRLVAAADRAGARYANQEAIDLYELALASLAELDGEEDRAALALSIDERRGEVLARTNRNAEARAVYDAALARLPAGDRIARCRMLRLKSNVWMAERQFGDALAASLEAERVLGPEPEANLEWRRERNEVRLDRMWAYYWLGDLPQIFSLVEGMRPELLEHGTRLQRIRLHQGIAHVLMRRDRYTASDEMRDNAREILRLSEEQEDLTMIAYSRFLAGFTAFFARDLESAERHLSAGLELSTRIGDVGNQSRSLTYLTATRRMAGKVDQVEEMAGRSLELAREHGMHEYEAAAEAQLGWVRWRRGELDSARDRCLAALGCWREYAGHYPLEWFGRWPLLAVALATGDEGLAREQARSMLDASQQPPPEPIRGHLESALAADVGAREILADAVREAKEFGYL